MNVLALFFTLYIQKIIFVLNCNQYNKSGELQPGAPGTEELLPGNDKNPVDILKIGFDV